MKDFEISYYHDYISPKLAKHLLEKSKNVPGIEGLQEVGQGGGIESKDSLKFLTDLYTEVKPTLKKVLKQRVKDRKYIDDRVGAYCEYNNQQGRKVSDPNYQTILGLEDASGRVVIGPLNSNYAKAGGDPVAPIPNFLKGPHVTLFGPPDSAKMAINAMNAYHRKLNDEPPIVQKLLDKQSIDPKWGADDEDSKTPLREDLVDAAVNLTACFNGDLKFEDKKKYELAQNHLSVPIKRFPGLALPCPFLFLNNSPIPLHLYDFALHLFENWHNPQSLTFYVPKLENEEEAKYIHQMVSTAEDMIKEKHPEYVLGTVRLMIVLENPRAILRTHEIMDALYPCFVGASLGWHDYLGSTARLLKEDSNYRIPVKADPDIVIKYIKASHLLLAEAVGSRGGIKVGGMYGILPIDSDTKSESFQMTLVGYIKDVITQMKRNLTGFWVAHPDFVRLGIAFVIAWKEHEKGDSTSLKQLISDLLLEPYHEEVFEFVFGDDIDGMDIDDPNYVRSLLVADIEESDFISNSHPDEIRYNVFQSLQYLTDWLCGNGCVALPAIVKDVPVRVMDDLATAERSRWEVWHEIYHGRFSKEDFIRIVHEEMNFIRRDLSNDKKIVQVKYNEVTSKWYPVALRLMLKLMTDKKPPEFATELLMPFTVEEVRNSDHPLMAIESIDPGKYYLEDDIRGLNRYFEACGCDRFAKEMGKNAVLDLKQAQELIMTFSLEEILQAASFHGDIGESKKSLDHLAASEQSKVIEADEGIRSQLVDLGNQYLEKFGFKFLVSAKGKSAEELLDILKTRLERSQVDEMHAAREALWEITKKRLPSSTVFDDLKDKHKISRFSIAATLGDHIQCLGDPGVFQYASLSKTMGAVQALECFNRDHISIDTPVNELLKTLNSPFTLKDNKSDPVKLKHLMNHTALNMHYVKGFPNDREVPDVVELLQGQHGYEEIKAINPPGDTFQYSGGGFLLLEHLVDLIEKKPARDSLPLHYDQLENKKHLKFPTFAAGAVGTAEDYLQFLKNLSEAYNHLEGSQDISHATAVEMLFGVNRGSVQFMGAKMGLGVFVIEAGDNKIALHQGANDGYRALSLFCFSGPDCGKGFVVLAEGDNEAVPFIAECAQALLQRMGFLGIEFERFVQNFDHSEHQQDEKVNQSYKTMVFDAFDPCLPDRIYHQRPLRENVEYDLAQGAEIKNVSNQKFARAENLISPHKPQFSPLEFCAQGKVMDSWETKRHNEYKYHFLELHLKQVSDIHWVMISTEFHDGNQVQWISLEHFDDAQKEWVEFLPKTPLKGHSYIKLKLPSQIQTQIVKVKAGPDGGLSRLGLYKDVPDESEFDGQLHRWDSEIPQTLKPMSLPWEENMASWGEVLSATDEHYSPAKQILSPLKPIHMFDGFESARSREPGHFEEIVLSLNTPQTIKGIEFDFTHFINNNPKELSVDGFTNGEWQELQSRVNVKAYGGNKILFSIPSTEVFEKLRVRIYPDGGFNRIRLH